MSTSIQEDIDNLKSKDKRLSDSAYLSLVNKKKEALPALLELLHNKQESGRELAAEAIANIADQSVADEMFGFLQDENERVRSWSAVTLRKVNDPRALDALLKTINDTPDLLHSEQTLATYALIRWGNDILLPVIALLVSPVTETRVHAFGVVKKIVFNNVRTKENWEKVWIENGAYTPALDAERRMDCMKKWEKWVEKNISL